MVQEYVALLFSVQASPSLGAVSGRENATVVDGIDRSVKGWSRVRSKKTRVATIGPFFLILALSWSIVQMMLSTVYIINSIPFAGERK